MEKPEKPQRAEPREIVELRQLKVDQPELAEAIDLQIQLLQLQRRVQSRVPLPALREAVTTVLLSEVSKLPKASSMRITGCVWKSTPAVAEEEG